MSNEITFDIETNSLGQQPASNAKVMVTLGICSQGIPNQLYDFSDATDAAQVLGQGPLVEAMADKLTFAGGPQLAVPLNPTNNGTVGTTNTSLVTGSATVTGSAAPSVPLSFKIQAAGALATMTFSASVNGGAYAAPVPTTGSPFPYLVPGTLTKIIFAAGTYVLGDVYSISTLGVVTRVGTGPSASNLTFTASPLDGYDIRVDVTGAGALGAGLFRYSVDGNNTPSEDVLIPSGGAFAIPNAGVVLTFSGTFVLEDEYSIAATTAAFGTSDVTAALVMLRQNVAEWFGVHVFGAGANAAAAASLAAVLSTQMDAAANEDRFVRAVIDCPDVEADATIATAFASFSDERVSVCVGDISHISSLSAGRKIRRNCSIVYTTRLCATQPSEHPGWVGSPLGALKAVDSLYQNFGQTNWNGDFLNTQRFVTLKARGTRGYFVKAGNTMAPGGSDFAEIMNCRVMDEACRATLIAEEPYLNIKLPVNDDGTLQAEWAETADQTLTASVADAVVAVGDAVKVVVTLSKTANVLSLKRLPTKIKITPFAYAEGIDNIIGFISPALAA